jgi:hypothetical protein
MEIDRWDPLISADVAKINYFAEVDKDPTH